MTLLSLLAVGYKALQKRLDQQYTYQSMEHLDERLMIDVGMCRQGNRIVALLTEESALLPSSCAEKTVAVYSGCPAHAEQCCLLQDSGG
ncbi:hypothetical protein [Neptunomonas antarctica]|uniref:Uncharacterized protein n=1 Tax=Neptunomonas antarctica TaxID=619304 RepID=A0A1N7N8K3_9GAMM|nr:hypothetical protein [Neptunomonas antarctica]SIS94670.1 hypothetical protein SAMN05421760_108134 [Neptunomonas antarctica]